MDSLLENERNDYLKKKKQNDCCDCYSVFYVQKNHLYGSYDDYDCDYDDENGGDDNDVENFVNSMINEDEMRGFFGGCAEFNE